MAYITITVDTTHGKVVSGAVTRERGEKFATEYLIKSGCPDDEIPELAHHLASVGDEDNVVNVGDWSFVSSLCKSPRHK